MRIAISILPLLLVAAGCSSSSEPPTKTAPTPPAGRVVANTRVQDPKARFLGEAGAYMSNLFSSDKAMVEEFTSTKDGAKLKDLIVAAHESEKRDFGTLDVPPKAYGPIIAKLYKVHQGHSQAYLEYLRTFTDGKAVHVDKGNSIMKRALADLNDAQKMVSVALDKDVK